MKGINLFILFFIFAGVFIPVSSADLYGNSKYIQATINESQINGTQNNISLQLFINISSNVTANGTNVRIYYNNLTEVPRCVESYNQTTGNLSIFYNANISSAKNNTMRLYYGNMSLGEPAADSTYGCQNVWNNTIDAAYLYSETPSGASSIIDRTSNSRHGTPYNMESGDITNADYGLGYDLDGVNEYITAPTGITSYPFVITMVYDADTVRKEEMYSLTDASASNIYYAHNRNPITFYHALNTRNTADTTEAGTTVATANKEIYHLVHRSNTDREIYVNGVSAATGTASVTFSPDVDTFIVGGFRVVSFPTNEAMDGLISFSQVYSVDVGENWIATQSNNLINPTASGADPFYKSISGELNTTPEIISWNNNVTNNQSLNITIFSGRAVQFSITLSNNSVDYLNWTVAGDDKNINSTIFNWTFANSGSFAVVGSATYTANNITINKTWNVSVMEYVLAPVSPANNSFQNTVLTLTAREWPSDSPYIWYVSTDNQFINIIQQGSGTVTNETITGSVTGLSEGTIYYWRFKNNTGGYSETWQFTTNTTASVPGRLNITALDEDTNALISSFNATLYNNSAVLSKTTSTGWANFSASEVTSSEYLVRVDAGGYAPRNVLVTSPNNLTVYLPNSTLNTINTVAFYLIDTTGLFPWQGSVMNITKNGSIMASSYFDADSKMTAYLIQGDSYSITISYNDNLQNWGNYIPVSSGNVEILLTQIAINESANIPFLYNITYDTSEIVLEWTDPGNVVSSLNYTIYQGAARTLVHQLITSVDHGTSTYLITNSTGVYYIYFNAVTSEGNRTQIITFDAQTGTQRTDRGLKSNWGEGSFSVPSWVYTSVAILSIILLAAGMGSVHAGFGAIITIVLVILYMSWGILQDIGAGIGFFGGLGVMIFMYYMRSKDTESPVMMAYKIAMFMIFFNFAVMIINGSGILSGTYVDVYGNDCTGAGASTSGCIISRISTLAPYEVGNDGAGMWQQISFVLVTATAFGLIILTLQYMLALFWFGVGVTSIYLAQLPIPWEWKLVIQAGVLIVYVTGFMEYKAATSLKDKE